MLSGVNHELQDKVSLELARCVAARLRESPELLGLARDNLARWTRLNSDAPALLRCYAEWREILELPVQDICDLLCAETAQGQRLRQNSPFAGVLSPAEVWELKARLRLHAKTPA